MQDLATYRRQLVELIERGQELKILTLISRFHPDDIAALIDALEEEQKSRLFRLLDVETASDVIMELDDLSRDLIIEDLSSEKLSELVDDMPSDDAADLIADLPREQAREVLSHIDQEKSEDVQKLLEYPDDSAGGIMQTELVAVDEDARVRDVVEDIRSRAAELEDIHNVFVHDAQRQLSGVLPLRKLILAAEGTRIGDIMDRNPLYATVDQDQEEVATSFRKYDIVSMPVLDAHRQIVGRITVDDVIDVIEEEDSEDIFRMAGISEEEDLVYSGPALKVSLMRLPWLVFNFFGTLISGYFLFLYQSKMPGMLSLLAFVPVIMAMSGNMGVQSTSIIIRGLAIGRIDFMNLRRTVLKECYVGIIVGLLCGVLGGVIGLVIHRSILLGVVVFLAMFVAIAFGALMGVLVPLFFRKLHIDPAVASGALIATANDLVAINIYFLLAALLTRMFGVA